MEKKRLMEIIENGESTGVELKKSLGSMHDIAKTISAFSNTQGGLLIFGVNQIGKVEGLARNADEIQQKISSSNSLVNPKPLINIEVQDIDNKKIIIVAVHKADSSVFHSVDGAIYIRIGSTTHRLEGHSILEFLRYRQILLFEESIEPLASTGDLDINKIIQYLKKRDKENYLKEHSIEDFLINKKLVSFQPDMKIKNLALLFFAKDAQEFFPFAIIKMIRFDGAEPVKVIAYEDSKGNPAEIIEHSMNFVKRFLTKEFIIKGLKREEITLLPEGAIREAIINSVAHRDYFNKNEIQLSIFDDRIEITNPGGLPEGMRKELLGSLSIQRNPGLYQLLKDYGYMEGIGSGIARIYRTMLVSNLSKPEFIISEDFFRIIMRIKKQEDTDLETKFNLNSRQVKALAHLKTNKKIKSKEYASMNKISITAALNDLKKLEKLKLVEKIGSYRGAYYILNE